MLLRRIALLTLAAFLVTPAWAGMNYYTNWDVRTGGSDSNGGCFDSTVASPGTDYSQQNSPQVAFTDLVIGATNTQLTSAAHAFSSTSPGNCIHITGGTGFTTGWYEILSVSGSTATMDRAVGTAASTSGTGNLGGSMATATGAINVTGGNASASNPYIWVQSGTYTVASSITATGYQGLIAVIGYQTTHGDGGTKPLITASTGSRLFPLAPCNNGSGLWCNYLFKNIAFSNTASSPTGESYVALYSTSNNAEVTIDNCTFTGFSYAIDSSDGAGGYFNNILVYNSYFTGWNQYAINQSYRNLTLVNTVLINGHGDAIFNNLQGNSETVVNMWNSIIANVTSGYCINTTNGNSFYMALDNSIIYNCASGGVYVSASNAAYNGNLEMYNTIVYGNGTYGINFSGGSCGIPQIFHNNAFGSNTTAATSGLCANDSTPAGTITLTANPFVSASTGNFALNSTSGGGALLRAAGWVSAFPGISTSNYLSVGPAQLAAGGGSTASNYGWAK